LSYRHSLPNKLFEAAMAELPVCVSDLPDMRDFVEELGIGHVMDQTKPDSIAATLRQALNQKESCRSSEHARHLLANKYGWSAQVKTLLDLYDSLLQPPDNARNLNIESRGEAVAVNTGA
jgi:glycosyltransferase involved in cell wall biosynthesis